MITTKISHRLWGALIPVPVLLVTTIIAFLHPQSSAEDKLVSSLFLLLFTSIAAFYLWSLRRYVVDAESKTLIVESYFSKTKKTFPFSYFDSVNSILEWRPRGGPVRILRFIKDKEVIFKLSGDIYKNLDDVEQHLSSMTITRMPLYTFWRKAARFLYRNNT